MAVYLTFSLGSILFNHGKEKEETKLLNMPYVRRGKIVYKKVGNKLVRKGASSSPEKAEKYMRALYANEK